jgi:putative transposase
MTETGVRAGWKRHSPEEIVRKLREGDRIAAEGRSIALVAHAIGVTQATYARWRRSYGGLESQQVLRVKQLEAENARLRKAISELDRATDGRKSSAVQAS